MTYLNQLTKFSKAYYIFLMMALFSPCINSNFRLSNGHQTDPNFERFINLSYRIQAAKNLKIEGKFFQMKTDLWIDGSSVSIEAPPTAVYIYSDKKNPYSKQPNRLKGLKITTAKGSDTVIQNISVCAYQNTNKDTFFKGHIIFSPKKTSGSIMNSSYLDFELKNNDTLKVFKPRFEANKISDNYVDESVQLTRNIFTNKLGTTYHEIQIK